MFNLHPILRKVAPPAAKAEPDAYSCPNPVFRTTRIKKAPHPPGAPEFKNEPSLYAAAGTESIPHARVAAGTKLEDVVSAMRASQRMIG